MEDDEEQEPFTAYDYWEEVYEDTMEYLKYMMQTTREDASIDLSLIHISEPTRPY